MRKILSNRITNDIYEGNITRVLEDLIDVTTGKAEIVDEPMIRKYQIHCTVTGYIGAEGRDWDEAADKVRRIIDDTFRTTTSVQLSGG